MAVDPLASDYQGWSPYNYAACNPIRIIDPNGEGWGDALLGFVSGFGKGAVGLVTSPLTTLQFVASYKNDPVGTTVAMASGVQEKYSTLTNMSSSNDFARSEIIGEITFTVASTIAISGAANISKAGKVTEATTATTSKSNGATETVQRAMSKAELNATEKTGLVRGGREGTHFVSDNVNNNAGRAMQRLALPEKPEVKVTMQVPKGSFSKPSEVQPANNMPGGGMERTAIGKIPAKVITIKEY